jgi:hypothetical protein
MDTPQRTFEPQIGSDRQIEPSRTHAAALPTVIADVPDSGMRKSVAHRDSQSCSNNAVIAAERVTALPSYDVVRI